MKEEITLGFCYKGNWIDSIRLDITAFGFVVVIVIVVVVVFLGKSILLFLVF